MTHPVSWRTKYGMLRKYERDQHFINAIRLLNSTVTSLKDQMSENIETSGVYKQIPHHYLIEVDIDADSEIIYAVILNTTAKNRKGEPFPNVVVEFNYDKMIVSRSFIAFPFVSLWTGEIYILEVTDCEYGETLMTNVSQLGFELSAKTKQAQSVKLNKKEEKEESITGLTTKEHLQMKLMKYELVMEELDIIPETKDMFSELLSTLHQTIEHSSNIENVENQHIIERMITVELKEMVHIFRHLSDEKKQLYQKRYENILHAMKTSAENTLANKSEDTDSQAEKQIELLEKRYSFS